jgi:SLOG cluster3 family
MTSSTPKSGGNALRGKTILLSASVPTEKRAEQYSRVTDAAFEIEQAVISLARAVFSEGGRLVFGGHPAISPLVAMVVGEYREPRFAESLEERRLGPVEIFQSHAFDGYLPDDTVLMYKLGYASIHWVEAVDQERFQPGTDTTEMPCPKSLKQMREDMLEVSRPDAMVCIGEMEGLEEEVSLALGREPSFPIFVLERTGGAAALLRNRRDQRLRMIDTEIVSNLERMRAEMGSEQTIEARAHRALVPYPLVMQTIVEEVSRPSVS